jgi:hypothetical protein
VFPKIEEAKNLSEWLGDRFRHYYGLGANFKNNPVLDKRLADFDPVEVVQRLREGDIFGASSGINLNGVGVKIRSFFIRDMICLFALEGAIFPRRLQQETLVERYLMAFPIDIWLRAAVKSINQPCDVTDDKILATIAIESCLGAGVSPLRFNMGTWFFSSTYVADVGRLRLLLNGDKPGLVKEEKMLDGFA